MKPSEPSDMPGRGTSAALVSVIVPTHNRADLLKETLDSIASQSHPAIETIVVDDGGSDSSKAIVALHKNAVYQWQPQQGVSAARNLGVHLSSGQYIQFLDSDDLLEWDKLRVQVEYLETRLSVDIVYGDARYFTTQAPQRRDYGLHDYEPMADCGPWIKEAWEAPGSMATKLVRSNIMPVCCPLVRRSAIQRIGRWTEEISENEDWEFWARGAAGGLRFQFLERPNTLALIRSHSDSASRRFTPVSAIPLRFTLARSLRGELAALNYMLASDLIRQQPRKLRIQGEMRLLGTALSRPRVIREIIQTRLLKRLRASGAALSRCIRPSLPQAKPN